MKLTPEMKAEIDAMSYEDLLRGWRFAKIGDERFQGEVGEYWGKRMFGLRDADPAAAVAASKRIGWGD